MSKGKLENYDPASLFDASSLVRSEIYSFDDEAGREITYIPGKPGEKEPEEIRTSVRRAYMAFRQAEEWARAQPREVSDEEALELARELYQDIYLTVSKNCFRVYLTRVEEGGEDTAKERQTLAELRAKPDFDQQLLAAQESWVDKLILKMGAREAAERAQESVRDARLYIDKHLMSAAIMESEEELPQDVDEAVWFQTLDRNFRAETEKSTEYFYKGYVQSQVRGILEGTYKPTEMPLKQLGQLAGLGWLDNTKGKRGSVSDSIKLDGMVRFPVDYGAKGITEYFGGQKDPLRIVDGLAQIAVEAPRGQKREVALAQAFPQELVSIIDPESVEPALERIRNERNEVKAKAFVGVLALANQPGVTPEKFFVTLEDLMLLVTGYERTGKNKTNSAYYWAKAAEVIKYLLLDLACTQVNILVKLPQDKDPLYVAEWLMHRPRMVAKQTSIFGDLLNRVVLLSNRGENAELASYLKQADLQGFYLGFPKDILSALGTTTGTGKPNALESISRDVLKLKGPAFWLAYEIAFLRRWAKPQHAKPEKGKSLLETLEKHGYCEKSSVRTGGRVSFKDALKYWFDDIAALTNINMLEDPGALIYEARGGRWIDVTKTVRSWLKDRGVRITQDDICNLKVLYQVPAERLKELAKPRAKMESQRQSYARSQAGNAGRSAAKKAG